MLCGSTRTRARQMFSQETQGRKRPLSWEHEDVGVHQMVGEGREGSSHPHRESSMCKSPVARRKSTSEDVQEGQCGRHRRRVGRKAGEAGQGQVLIRPDLCHHLYTVLWLQHIVSTRGTSAGAASARWGCPPHTVYCLRQWKDHKWLRLIRINSQAWDKVTWELYGWNWSSISKEVRELIWDK